MAGEGKRRSEWNTLLLRDVIGPIYASLVLNARRVMGPGAHHRSLLPAVELSKPWEMLVAAVYDNLKDLPVLYSNDGDGDRGRWIAPGQAVVVEGEVDDNGAEEGGRERARGGRAVGGAATEQDREYINKLSEVYYNDIDLRRDEGVVISG